MQKLHNTSAATIFEALCRCTFFVLGMTLFFSGCSRKTSVQKEQETLHLGHAKHFDIPYPVGFSSSTRKVGNDGDYLLYTGTMPRNNVLTFYLREMEHNGWEIENFSNHLEGMLVCTKPHKQCTLSIRSEHGKSNVHVFVKQTQGA